MVRESDEIIDCVDWTGWYVKSNVCLLCGNPLKKNSRANNQQKYCKECNQSQRRRREAKYWAEKKYANCLEHDIISIEEAERLLEGIGKTL